jgi:hypothetical protein
MKQALFIILFLLTWPADSTTRAKQEIRSEATGSSKLADYGPKFLRQRFFSPALLFSAPDQQETRLSNSTGKVELRQKPRIGHKYFVIISDRRIGFGVGGATLGGKYYPDGTVFEITRLINQDRYLCIMQEGKERCYDKKFFNGSRGSAGSITGIKWDWSNNRPTGFDLEEQKIRRYYHAFILYINENFWPLFIIMILASISSYFVFGRKEPDTKIVSFIVFSFIFIFFILGGAYEGSIYEEYLDKFDRIYPEEVNEKIKTKGLGGFSILPAFGSFEIKLPFKYKFVRLFYFPLFLCFHIAFLFYLYNLVIALTRFTHYLLVPHPIEKHIKAVKKRKMEPGQALERISSTMYDLEKEGIPADWRSKNWRKRIEALTQRVKAEDEFMNQVINLLKTRSKF